MMTVCYIPGINKKSFRENFRFMYVSPIVLTIGVNLINLSEIILKIFDEDCELNVFGFNKNSNEIWGKKIIKSESLLHSSLSISKREYSISYIKIIPIVGSKKDIKRFTLKIIDKLKFYECK